MAVSFVKSNDPSGFLISTECYEEVIAFDFQDAPFSNEESG
jgi:hypothetical protein